MNRILGVLTCTGLLAATAALAAPEFVAPQLRYDRSADSPRFRAGEVSLDAFGTLSVGDEDLDHFSLTRVDRDGRLGLGLGSTYFFHRYVGLEAEAYTENTAHSFVDNAGGSLVVRFPIESVSLAPYALGGGGYQFDPVEQGFAHIGGGVEFRFSRSFGIFIDARYVFADKTENYGLGRLGVRFIF